MNMHHRWTQTDVTHLRDQLNIGGSVDQIAQMLARSHGDVRTMMARLGLHTIIQIEHAPA